MAKFKTEEAREVEALEQIEERIARRDWRERLHRVLIAGLGTLLALSVAAHFAGGCKYLNRR